MEAAFDKEDGSVGSKFLAVQQLVGGSFSTVNC